MADTFKRNLPWLVIASIGALVLLSTCMLSQETQPAPPPSSRQPGQGVRGAGDRYQDVIRGPEQLRQRAGDAAQTEPPPVPE